MASTTPRIIARPSRANGVLSVPAAATQKKNGPSQDAQQSRTASIRSKIVIRRLPPGLTQAEFEDAIGDDWKPAGDRLDWAVYKPGKISKDPAKPSKPSRAYLHVTKQEHIASLSEKVRNTTFSDAKGSSKDSSLLGPPSVEFAPYGRVPNSRPRKDARQGTIDQDPEFIDFLESLTNPIAKSAPVDQENVPLGKATDKVTVTPLIQFLRDKKANKGKENASPAKNAKHARQDLKDSKPAKVEETVSINTTTAASSPKKRSAQAVKVEQAARDAVKVLNKQAASKATATSSTQTTTPAIKPPTVVPNSTANAALADKRRERGNASAAAKILQRDLGLDRNAAGRGGRRGLPGNAARPMAMNATTAKEQDKGASPTATQVEAKSTSATDAAPSASSVAPKPTVAQAPLGPAALRNSLKASTPTAHSAPTSQKPAPPPSTSTQAFLKHANPSQGITEPLLDEAFAVFGAISKVEIDKKKGFAYVDFADPESLQKAIKASPIKVAQGQVVVLERKSGPTLQARNIRGGGPMMGNRGGGIPVGGRGGSIRGRGGFGRGGHNMPNVNNTRPVSTAANSSSTQSTATAQASTAPPAIAEISSSPSSHLTPASSTATTTAD